MKWQDYKDEFEVDGSLRDIYVLDTNVLHWQHLLAFFRSGVYKYSCTINCEQAALPLSAGEMFDAAYELRPLLSVNVGAAILNCHFFTKEEIEFDLDPSEIQSESQAEEVFAFMRQIGQILYKEVVLTPENAQDAPIFKFLPSVGQIQYIPCDT